MKARFVHEGKAIDYTPGADVAAGSVVVLGNLVGFAKLDIAAGTLGALHLTGVYDVEKANEEITQGAATHYDADGDPYDGEAGSGAATTTSGGNTFMGFALATAAATDTHVRIVCFGALNVTNTVHSDLSKIIADPGDAGAIPVTDTGSVAIVTAGAETRALADPSYAGQVLSLSMDTDGGDCVVTAATAVNQTGNNTLTFADAGDVLVLVAVDVAGSPVWRVMSNDGVALSTV